MTEKQRLQALVVFCVLCILLITLVVPTLIAKVIILFLAFMLIALLSLNAFQDSETDDEPLYIPESWHLPPQSVARRVTRLLTFKEVKLLASIEMQVAVKSMWPGVSIILIWCFSHWQVVAAEVIVMPRSFSCSIQSISASPS